jgi:hypothetical protein
MLKRGENADLSCLLIPSYEAALVLIRSRYSADKKRPKDEAVLGKEQQAAYSPEHAPSSAKEEVEGPPLRVSSGKQ